MAGNSPLARVKEKFGDKAKLVESLEKLTGDELWVARTNKDKGLAHVSNAKLLRLHALFSEVKEKFGTREKLIDALLELEQRTKDVGFRQKISAWPVPRLYDSYKSLAKRLRVRSGADAKAAEGGKAAPKAPGQSASVAKSAKGKPAKATAAGGEAKKPEKAKKTGKKAAAAPKRSSRR
jgi:hypothetical protein